MTKSVLNVLDIGHEHFSVVIIPAGTPHGWSNIPDHVEYLSFRPSQTALTAGYVHPSIRPGPGPLKELRRRHSTSIWSGRRA